MKKLFSVLILLVLVASIKAQAPVDTASSTLRIMGYLNAEIGGNGGVYSVNYQKMVWYVSPKARIFLHAGLSVLPRGGGNIIFDFPVSVNWVRPMHKFDDIILGTGQVLILSTRKGGTIRGTFRVGYRWNFRRRIAYLELAYTPFYSYIYNFQYDNWVAFSFGYRLTRKEK